VLNIRNSREIVLLFGDKATVSASGGANNGRFGGAANLPKHEAERINLMIYGVLSKLAKTTVADGVKHVSIPQDVFSRILVGAIKHKALFDEKFYLETYPDIATAVKSGQVSSGLEHYVVAGYFEDRFPRKLIVDERFYLQENPDVADAIKKGLIRSAQEHFEDAGFREGRAPYNGFSVF
jgi:hypothetical protein